MNPPPPKSDQGTSTPSPTASASSQQMSTTPNNNGSHTNGTPNANQSRRPPRKSTLTQQQKNQKRQRATQEQLVLLEHEFSKNATPTAATRERIAQDINMTERSVQIWFQNRRAKIKLLTRKSLETGEDCDAIPESYRQYLAAQAMNSGKPLDRSFFQQPMFGAGGMMLPPDHQSSQKVVIHHFQCRSLSIGTWRRVGQNAMDLVIFYSLGDKPCLTYYINNDAAGYKIEFPFSYIKNITLENGQGGPNTRPAGLVVELNRPPHFFMDNAGSGGFNQCGDFTENQQASQVLMHHLGGDPRVLSGQLAKLTLLESFRNRFNPMFDNSAVAISAPVSPIGRPASQPNVMAPPPMPQHHHDFGMTLQPGPRGHKRQRSRSVPAITDFSFLSQPIPLFHVQHPSTTITDASIFAPVPQHPNNLSPGQPLRINTAPSYAVDFGRQHYPMSAATTGSPSEYASPGFFGPGSDMEHMQNPHVQPSYTVPFLSPMPEHTGGGGMHPSPSPLSAASHGDPVIADQSPPLANMPRSASADFLGLTQDQSGIAEDGGLMLGDMFQKSNFSLPFRGNGLDDNGLDMNTLHDDPHGNDLRMQQSMGYGTIDPSALEQPGM